MAEMNDDKWIALGREVLRIEAEGLTHVSQNMGKEFVAAVGLLASCQGRVVLTGVGKAGLVARKIAATLSSTGTPAFFLHPVEGAHGDLGSIQAVDIVLALSNSGRTDELIAIIPPLRVLGARVIALTGASDSPLAQLADIVLNTSVTREACPLDLAPTASTTAMLGMGDALAVALIRKKDFSEEQFHRFHPGGSLGKRLQCSVGALMRTEAIPQIEATATMQQALQVLHTGELGAVVVTDSQLHVLGILTDGDVRRSLYSTHFDNNAPVTSSMTLAPQTGSTEQSAAELLDIMETKAITVLPIVTAEARLCGIIHLHDLLGKGLIRFSDV